MVDSQSTARKPNILLISSDQQHYATLGFNNPKIKTPALDRLAREGRNFSRAYCPNPTCTPTRGSIITGLYPSVHGAYTLGTKVPEHHPTLGGLLHDQGGYRTSLIGKAHFQPLKSTEQSSSLESYPTLHDLEFWKTFNDTHTPWYGFDHCELARNHADEAHVGQHYALWMKEQGLSNWGDYFQSTQGPASPYSPTQAKDAQGAPRGQHMHWPLPAEYHYTTWTGERTRAEIRRCVEGTDGLSPGTPFFCWSSYHDPHPPYAVPEPWASMYDPADMEPGELQPGELDKMPPPHRMTQQDKPDFGPFNEDGMGNHGYHRQKHTREGMQLRMAIYYGMISFMDDQIGKTLDLLDELGQAQNTLVVFTSDHGHYTGQHGLHAKGAFHYEDGIRVPLLARWPGRVPAGKTTQAIQSLIDLPPTFATAAGLDVPRWMQGVNQLPAWQTKSPLSPPPRDHAIVENHHNGSATHLRTFITDRYKLTVYRDRPWGELFDLEQDPGEIDNHFDDRAYAQVKAELFESFMNAELRREPAPMPRVAGA